MSLPIVHVMSLVDANIALQADSSATTYKSVVSISHTDVGNRPVGLDDPRRDILLLTFEDSDDCKENNAPTYDDVLKILDFADTHREDKYILVHCFAGISRSSATAIIMYALWLGPGKHKEAVERVKDAIQYILPNQLIIKMADEELGFGGKLILEAAKLRDRYITDAAFTQIW